MLAHHCGIRHVYSISDHHTSRHSRQKSSESPDGSDQIWVAFSLCWFESQKILFSWRAPSVVSRLHLLRPRAPSERDLSVVLLSCRHRASNKRLSTRKDVAVRTATFLNVIFGSCNQVFTGPGPRTSLPKDLLRLCNSKVLL